MARTVDESAVDNTGGAPVNRHAGAVDLDTLARRQHGVVSRRQSLEHLTAEAIRWRLSRGDWSRIHAGVYRVHTGELSWHGRASAALLRLGVGAALSGAAAAHLLGFEDAAPAVLDLGDSFGATRQDAVAVAARAVQRRRVTVDQLVAELAARRTHQHRRALELALGVIDAGAESGLEVGFHQDVVAAHGLPSMRMAVPDTGVAGSIRRDFEEVERGVIVEVDGKIGHGEAERDRDNRRDRLAARTGRVTLRCGWVDVEFDPCGLAADLYGTLTSRGYCGPIRPCGPGCTAAAAARTAG